MNIKRQKVNIFKEKIKNIISFIVLYFILVIVFVFTTIKSKAYYNILEQKRGLTFGLLLFGGTLIYIIAVIVYLIETNKDIKWNNKNFNLDPIVVTLDSIIIHDYLNKDLKILFSDISKFNSYENEHMICIELKDKRLYKVYHILEPSKSKDYLDSILSEFNSNNLSNIESDLKQN